MHENSRDEFEVDQRISYCFITLQRDVTPSLICLIFTALHVMQTRYSDVNSVCPYVCLSVCLSVFHTREL